MIVNHEVETLEVSDESATHTPTDVLISRVWTPATLFATLSGRVREILTRGIGQGEGYGFQHRGARDFDLALGGWFQTTLNSGVFAFSTSANGVVRSKLKRNTSPIGPLPYFV